MSVIIRSGPSRNVGYDHRYESTTVKTVKRWGEEDDLRLRGTADKKRTTIVVLHSLNVSSEYSSCFYLSSSSDLYNAEVHQTVSCALATDNTSSNYMVHRGQIDTPSVRAL